jgi:hypothetical protein
MMQDHLKPDLSRIGVHYALLKTELTTNGSHQTEFAPRALNLTQMISSQMQMKEHRQIHSRWIG